ncbi:hypothetical protein GW17_00058212 [Ensete ventricosum]|nr:hypothetical protein GW17_00058212 [Ensete ventricosum]
MAAAAGDVEVVDFEPDEDDLMDEEVAAAEVDPSPAPRLRSAIAGSGSSGPRKTKGRGFREEAGRDSDSRLAARDFDSLDSDGGPGPQRCKFGDPNPMVICGSGMDQGCGGASNKSNLRLCLFGSDERLGCLMPKLKRMPRRWLGKGTFPKEVGLRCLRFTFPRSRAEVMFEILVTTLIQ